MKIRLDHWSVAASILIVFAMGLLVDEFPKAWEYGIVETHKVLGVAILLLVLIWFARRLAHRPPASELVNPVIDKAASLGHWGLYALDARRAPDRARLYRSQGPGNRF